MSSNCLGKDKCYNGGMNILLRLSFKKVSIEIIIPFHGFDSWGQYEKRFLYRYQGFKFGITPNITETRMYNIHWLKILLRVEKKN